uniref:Uncharacterized protein n=1 Tax=Sphaerodactylus townsendi TaxID=933632 RepID=A0ACB8G6C4_9SAUR
MADGTTLRIRALEKEDSCTLDVRVVFASGEVLRKTFRLSVFEPVPDPEIQHHLVSRTGEVCNVTLHCLGSEKGGIDVSWKRRNSSDQPGVPEEGSDADLHVSWQPDSLDFTFTCLLSNPAGQKSASLDLASICRSEGESHKDLNVSSGVSLGEGPAPAEANQVPQSAPDTLQENLRYL